MELPRRLRSRRHLYVVGREQHISYDWLTPTLPAAVRGENLDELGVQLVWGDPGTRLRRNRRPDQRFLRPLAVQAGREAGCQRRSNDDRLQIAHVRLPFSVSVRGPTDAAASVCPERRSKTEGSSLGRLGTIRPCCDGCKGCTRTSPEAFPCCDESSRTAVRFSAQCAFKIESASSRDPGGMYGGEGGIRTHVPLRTRRFRGAPVTTTSVPLRCDGTMLAAGTFDYTASTA